MMSNVGRSKAADLITAAAFLITIALGAVDVSQQALGGHADVAVAVLAIGWSLVLGGVIGLGGAWLSSLTPNRIVWVAWMEFSGACFAAAGLAGWAGLAAVGGVIGTALANVIGVLLLAAREATVLYAIRSPAGEGHHVG